MSLTDSSTQVLVSGSEASSKMSAICLALELYLQTSSEWEETTFTQEMGIIITGGLFVQRAGPGWMVRMVFVLYGALLPVGF